MYTQSDIRFFFEMIFIFNMQADNFNDAINFIQKMQKKFDQNPDDVFERKRDLERIRLYLMGLKEDMHMRGKELKELHVYSFIREEKPRGFEKYWGSSVLG